VDVFREENVGLASEDFVKEIRGTRPATDHGVWCVVKDEPKEEFNTFHNRSEMDLDYKCSFFGNLNLKKWINNSESNLETGCIVI